MSLRISRGLAPAPTGDRIISLVCWRRVMRLPIAMLVASLAAAAPAKSETERVVRIGLLLNAHLAQGSEAFVAEMSVSVTRRGGLSCSTGGGSNRQIAMRHWPPS
jgi:hypothetical protein